MVLVRSLLISAVLSFLVLELFLLSGHVSAPVVDVLTVCLVIAAQVLEDLLGGKSIPLVDSITGYLFLSLLSCDLILEFDQRIVR